MNSYCKDTIANASQVACGTGHGLQCKIVGITLKSHQCSRLLGCGRVWSVYRASGTITNEVGTQASRVRPTRLGAALWEDAWLLRWTCFLALADAWLVCLT